MSRSSTDTGASLICRMAPALPDEASLVPQQAMVQLLDHIRSVLVSLLSCELQTPLSVIEVAVETLIDAPELPVAVERQMLAMALTELRQLCDSVDQFLEYTDHVWTMTWSFLKARSTPGETPSLSSVFTELPEALRPYELWIEPAKARLTQFLHSMEQQAGAPFTPELMAILEQRSQQMTAIVTHELRTPLTTLQISLESLQHENSQELEIRRCFLEVAQQDVQRLCTVLQDLELLRRLETGQVCFQTEPVDLRSTLQTTFNTFLRQTDQDALSTIWIDPTARSLALLTDGARVVDVITRLLKNACQFTLNNKEVEVKAQILHPETQPDTESNALPMPTLRICIEDAGRGIDAEQLERIFDCFYQVEAYLQRTIGGMGIGLTICRYLIQGMGGQIWAESAGSQQGSRFCFTLPVLPKVEALGRVSYDSDFAR
ncbi:MAG: ATP-binding protein [Cyanobacteria bacterium P01_F01_bin.13]